MSWGDLLAEWQLIAPDLRSEYGVDVYDEALMAARPWAWLRDLILGLVVADTRIARHFQPDPPAVDARP